MQISQNLKLKQSQSLVMTPQLQQAIKLLQLNNLELSNLINKEFRPLKKPFSVGVEKFFSSEIKGLKKGKFIKVSFIPQNVVIKKHMKNAENIKYALNGI